MTGLGGAVNLIDGDTEIYPGVSTIFVGGHSPGSQAALVDTADGTVCVVVDVMDYYRNFEERIPVGYITSMPELLKAQTRLERLAEAGVYLLPAHDPLVFERFPKVAENVVQVRGW